MKKNLGKNFEDNIRKMFQQANVCTVRLYDPPQGYMGISNPSDLIIHKSPIMAFIECKSTRGNTFSFSPDSTKRQLTKMLEYNLFHNVVCGFMIWFIEHDYTCFIDVATIQNHLDNGNVSISYTSDLFTRVVPHTKVNGRKKQIYFDYDGEKFIDDFLDKYKEGD